MFSGKEKVEFLSTCASSQSAEAMEDLEGVDLESLLNSYNILKEVSSNIERPLIRLDEDICEKRTISLGRALSEMTTSSQA